MGFSLNDNKSTAAMFEREANQKSQMLLRTERSGVNLTVTPRGALSGHWAAGLRQSKGWKINVGNSG